MKTDQQLIDEINTMGRRQLASLWRFAPIGSEYFSRPAVYRVFKDKFDALGGFSPEVSKSIGWEKAA